MNNNFEILTNQYSNILNSIDRTVPEIYVVKYSGSY